MPAGTALRMQIPYLLLIAIAIFFASCKKDPINQNAKTTETETVTNGNVTFKLEFKDKVRLQGEADRDWTATERAPYVNQAQRWLDVLTGVDGFDGEHTVTIAIEVKKITQGNGVATVLEEATINGNTLPVRGALTVNNSTYSASSQAAEPREFTANILHEMGHVVGLGSLTTRFVSNDASLGGNAFRATGGMGAQMYSAAVNGTYDFVPFSDDGGHLYDPVRGDDKTRTAAGGGNLPPLTEDVMANGFVLGSVTLGVLDDIGWTVDYSKADAY